MGNDLLWHCRRLRKAIEDSDKKQLPHGFERFPKLCCGDASLLLARYLKRQGLGEFDYVVGDSSPEGEERTHAWLQKGNLVVDITVDQFDIFDDPVFVQEHSPWHSGWKIKHRHEAEFSVYEGPVASSLEEAYSEITRNLKQL